MSLGVLKASIQEARVVFSIFTFYASLRVSASRIGRNFSYGYVRSMDAGERLLILNISGKSGQASVKAGEVVFSSRQMAHIPSRFL